MSKSASGHVLYREESGALTAAGGLIIEIEDVSQIYPKRFPEKEQPPVLTDTTGHFLITYDPDIPAAATYGARRMALTVRNGMRRILTRLERDDVIEPVLNFGDVEIPKAVADNGLRVTLGGDKTTAVSSGNAITFLIDNEDAWGRLSDLMQGAASKIYCMQLDFFVPPDFEADSTDETPVLVFRFGPHDLSKAAKSHTLILTSSDDRPERRLVSRANEGIDVRILLAQPHVTPHIATAWAFSTAVALTLALAAAALGGAWFMVLNILAVVIFLLGIAITIAEAVLARKLSTFEEADNYFGAAPAPTVAVKATPDPLVGRTHAKLMIIDETEAVCIASPFTQSYFDDHSHRLDDPRRGEDASVPVHDVSISVRGPAVADLHEAFRLHWNDAVPGQPIAPMKPPAKQADGGDGIATLQVVRTLTPGRFEVPSGGERGVLEAYLRAIAAAKDLIYVENQYFTNETIGRALIAALSDKTRPKLKVIMLVNINPDIPTYPTTQRKLIAQIKKQIPDKTRFGVYTRWTHGSSGRIVPNYVHSKVAIVDDKWATVGSGNLDGASLDSTEFFFAGDVCNSEVNVIIFGGEGDDTSPGIVGRLRRRLWAEHLGLEKSPGVPNPDSAALAHPLHGFEWVKFWTDTAKAKLYGLKSNPHTPLPARILPWPGPDVDRSIKKPRDHLQALFESYLKIVEDPLTGLDPTTEATSIEFRYPGH